MELKPVLLFLSILLLSSCSLFKTTSVLHEYAETEEHSFSSILLLYVLSLDATKVLIENDLKASYTLRVLTAEFFLPV